MPTVYLHCGAPKTGTSYVQVLFAKHAEDLQAQGILYPFNGFVKGAKDGNITSGNGVLMANYLRPQLPHNVADKDAFIDDLEKMLRNGRGANFLFSSEFLVFPDNERTKRLAEMIKKSGYDVKVIYLVRDYMAAVRSSYSQQVKRSGESRTFKEFLDTWDPYYVHHTNLVKAAFGADSLSVYNYEEHKGDLPKLFFEKFLECNVDVEMTEVVNRSLSPSELELLRVFNEMSGGENAKASTYVSDALMRHPAIKSSKYAPCRTEYEAVEHRLGHSINLINELITGQKIKISSGVEEGASPQELSDFERFTVAVLSRLVVGHVP